MITRYASNRMAQREQRGFYGDLEDAGVTASVDTDIADRELPAAVADLLGVPAGTEVVVRTRHMRGDDQLLQIAATYLHPSVVAEIPQLKELNTGPGGMYARMEEAGHTLTQQDQVSARVPTEDEQAMFSLQEGAALLMIDRITSGADKQVLEVTQIIAAADKQRFVYDV